MSEKPVFFTVSTRDRITSTHSLKQKRKPTSGSKYAQTTVDIRNLNCKSKYAAKSHIVIARLFYLYILYVMLHVKISCDLPKKQLSCLLVENFKNLSSLILNE